MCGITGIVNWQEDLSQKRDILANMVKTIIPRGPDAQGVYLAKKAALGHSRLIINTLNNIAQPMIRDYDGEKLVITYNGAIYNKAELCAELKARAYQFTTDSDAELLLNAYIEWGESFVQRLNGVFAFAIWNETKETLFISRDRLGVKPLFYTQKGANFIFGSELKALLAHPEVEPKVDAEGLAEIFMLGPARTPGHGVFRDVYELKPGHNLIHTQQKTVIKQYWSFIADVHKDDFEKTVANVRTLFIDALNRQIVDDAPVCFLLSGGLDSSLITALASKIYQERGLGKLHTCSLNYVDNEKFFIANSFQPNSDEPWTQVVSSHFNTNHHTVMLDTPELSDNLAAAALARDLPGMADTDSSLYVFCREIKKRASVVLSGECADEVFGGYPWFYRPEMINADTFPWSMNSGVRLSWMSEDVKRKIRPMEYVAERYREALAQVPRLAGEDAHSAREREISYLSLTRFMPTLLDRKDRMCMANALEARVPFSDHRIVEYLFNVPWSMKYYAQREKGLLRYAFEGILPEDVLWRKKSPFPKTHNPGYTKNVVQKALSIFDEGTSALLPLLNVKNLREIAQTDLSAASVPWFGQLMSAPQLFAYLVQMDVWIKEYKVEFI